MVIVMGWTTSHSKSVNCIGNSMHSVRKLMMLGALIVKWRCISIVVLAISRL